MSRALRLALCLALGTLTTVIVAWWCDIATTIDETPAWLLKPDDVKWEWPADVPAGFPSSPNQSWKPHGFGLNVTSAVAHSEGPGPYGTLYRCVLFESGWPARAMAFHVTGSMEARGNIFSSDHDEPPNAWLGGIEPPFAWPVNKQFDFYDMRRLPLRPEPLGFAADSLLFSGSWWLLLTTPRLIASRVRTQRDLCPNCGYALAGLPASTPCPECGEQPT